MHVTWFTTPRSRHQNCFAAHSWRLRISMGANRRSGPSRPSLCSPPGMLAVSLSGDQLTMHNPTGVELLLTPHLTHCHRANKAVGSSAALNHWVTAEGSALPSLPRWSLYKQQWLSELSGSAQEDHLEQEIGHIWIFGFFRTCLQNFSHHISLALLCLITPSQRR